jgi:putative membrane protein
MKSLFVATAIAALAVPPAMAQATEGNSSTASRADSKFIEQVARDDQAEVDLAQLAQQKTQNPEVKALARRLAADHSKSNQQLMQIAQQDGVQPPARPDKSESKKRAKLEKLNGQAFDQAFVKDVVQDHEKDIKYFRKEQNSFKDPQLKSFAQQTLPVLQDHLQMAQQVQQAASGSSSQSSSPGSRTTH